MTSLPEQLSAARTQQLDAQFHLFRTFATQAIDNASRIASLNLATSRESAERTTRTMRQLLGATDPGALAGLRTHAEEQMRSLFAYSRELISIATSAQPQAARALAAAAPAALPAPDALAPAFERGAAVVQEAIQDTAQAAVASFQEAADSATDAVGKAFDAAPAPVTAPAPTPAPAPAPVPASASAPADPLTTLVQEQALKGEPAVVQSTASFEAAAAAVEQAAPVATPGLSTSPIADTIAKGAPKAAAAAPMAAPVDDRKSSSSAPSSGAPSKRKK